MKQKCKKQKKSIFLILSVVLLTGFMFSCAKVNEDAANSYRTRAIEKMKLGLYSEALEDLNNAVISNPGSYSNYYVRCKVKTELERYDEALIDCNRAVSVNKRSYHAYYYIGSLYMYFYEYEKSLTDFKKAKRYALKNKDNYYARNSHQYIQLLRKRLQKEDTI